MDGYRTRREFLALGGAVAATVTAGCQGDSGDRTATENDTETGTSGETTGPTDRTNPGGTTAPDPGTATPSLSDLSVSADRLATGFTSPVAVAVPRPGERYVVDQPGQIYRHTDGDLDSEPFLDLSDRMVPVSGYTEQGLLGLAFHPEFPTNGRFFVRYSAPPRAGTPRGYSHTFVLSEFRADTETGGAATETGGADPDSERTVLEIPQPQRNHNAGAITFGPDGYLYVAVGDGGGANDAGNGHVADWYDAVDGGNGQDVTENLLGSILRIDVDGEAAATPADAGENTRDYAIPEDNPLVGREGLDEQFAWGFRNPWRFSFGPDGRLFVADVGQNQYEEVNVVERGGNYGWNVREGTHCFQADDCPSESPEGRPLRDPVVEYPHGGQPVSGIAVVGGYLYGGNELPAFRDLYVFADWQAGGRLFAARETDDGLWPTATVSVDSEAQFGPKVLSFGRTPAGELLVCTTAETEVTGSTGSLFRLRSA